MIRWVSIILIGGACACADQASCDSDQELTNGACIPIAPDAGMGTDGAVDDAAVADGGDAAGEGGSDAMMCSDGVALGDPCSDGTNHTDCGCEAPYCALQPGSTTGTCTRTGCIEDPGVCPSGWTCIDLSAFSPDLPSICVES